MEGGGCNKVELWPYQLKKRRKLGHKLCLFLSRNRSDCHNAYLIIRHIQSNNALTNAVSPLWKKIKIITKKHCGGQTYDGERETFNHLSADISHLINHEQRSGRESGCELSLDSWSFCTQGGDGGDLCFVPSIIEPQQ